MSMNNQIGGIYLYKNDPKEVHKGVHITNVRQAQGGFAPLLAADDYKERKFDNTKYAYDSKAHHGTRPMHKSTLSLTHVRPEYNNYQTHNNFVSIWRTYSRSYSSGNPQQQLIIILFKWMLNRSKKGEFMFKRQMAMKLST